jgi:hypothetical protein
MVHGSFGDEFVEVVGLGGGVLAECEVVQDKAQLAASAGSVTPAS